MSVFFSPFGIWGTDCIASTFIKALQIRNPSLAIDVLGRPQLKEIITSTCSVRQFIEIDLPVFGHHRRDMASTWRACHTIHQLRVKRYDLCFNLVGDIRENLIGKLSRAHWNIAPIWMPGHIFKDKMTDSGAKWFANSGIEIPALLLNYYDSLSFFAHRLGLPDPFAPAKVLGSKGFQGDQKRMRVSLHPGASHPSRHWPSAKWRELISRLHERGCEIKLIGARDEAIRLRGEYGAEIDRFGIEIVTEDIPRFLAAISDSDLLIGMDSLSAHAAFASSTKSVVLNGSSDPRIMTPPGSVPLSAGDQCKFFPCNYQYPCKGGDREYVCCREIAVDSVVAAVDSLIGGRPR